MPYYAPLTHRQDKDRIIDGLLRLRVQLDDAIPARSLSDMLLATWNIREFDSPAYGQRTEDAFYFIAEIVSRFDIVAIQEVRRDLTALKRLMRVLGSRWDYIVTDTTGGDRGNNERLAYVFDTNRVRPSGLVGEIVVPPSAAGASIQLARTPLVAGFQCGWAKFQLTTVHILWGTSTENDPERVEEIDALAALLADRAADKEEVGDDNLVVLGDFNIFRPESDTMNALTSHGWKIPAAIQVIPGSNVERNKKYDQIAVRDRQHRFALGDRAGAFDYFESVFRDVDADAYADDRARPGKDPYQYKGWRTYQMSDHLPLWVQIKVDFSDEYLRELRASR